MIVVGFVLNKIIREKIHYRYSLPSMDRCKFRPCTELKPFSQLPKIVTVD